MVLPEPEVEPLVLGMDAEPDVLPVEPEAPMLLLDPVVPDEPLVAAAEPPAGVPVVPIGVSWVLRWPAPIGALAELGLGGVDWAKAVPTKATVARPASRPLSWFDAVIAVTPGLRER